MKRVWMGGCTLSTRTETLRSVCLPSCLLPLLPVGEPPGAAHADRPRDGILRGHHRQQGRLRRAAVQGRTLLRALDQHRCHIQASLEVLTLNIFNTIKIFSQGGGSARELHAGGALHGGHGHLGAGQYRAPGEG